MMLLVYGLQFRVYSLDFLIMIIKWIFDRVVALIGLFFLWPVLLIVAILVKVKMPGGPALFVQKRVGKDGCLTAISFAL